MAKKKAAESDKPVDQPESVQFWLSEIAAARKREKTWRKEGQRIIDIYDGTKADVTPFNILYSNTETMLPALYSAVPRPVVQRRFKDDDPLGRYAAMAGQRMLEFQLDTNIDGYETFNDVMKAGTLDGILPGRGVSAVKYDAEVGDEQPPLVAGEDPASQVAPQQYKKAELVCLESKRWDRVLFGFAHKWSRMPWIAYEEHLDKEECERLFGEELAGKLTYTTGEEPDEDEAGGEGSRTEDERDTGERKTVLVYQIWDKDGGRKIRYVAPSFRDRILKSADDPLGLTGFYNCPRPLQFVEKSSDTKPVALYTLYENQAKELNRLTIRINRIVEAIKARGAYDSSLGETLEKVMEGEDNTLVPTDATTSLAAEKGFDNAIWFMPLDVLINVLDKLYVAREQCKQTIYEIMGIADIMRGASKASETLGAQQIKNQWGTLRIKPKQAEVQRYARDLLRMMLEIAAERFSEQTWAQMTGLPFTTSERREQLMAIAQVAQANQIPLDANTQAELQKPSWGDVLGMLRTDTQRAYRIDIETNSTVEPEAAEDQKNIAELMNAMGQFLNGVGPLVQKGVMPFGVAKNMLLAISRRFRFGTEIEDDIKAMQAPPPEDDGAAKAAQEQAAQAQQAIAEAQGKAAQLEMQLKAAQAENQLITRKSDLDVRELELDTERKVFDMEKKVATESVQNKAQIETEKLNFKGQLAGLNKKQASSETAASQKAASKIAEVSDAIRMLTEAQTALLELVAATRMETQQLARLIAAPRVRVPVRGRDGRIERVIDEIQEQRAARPN